MSSIWKRPISVEILNTFLKDTAAHHLGIEVLEVGEDFIKGRVPVDARTRQPYGILHGGVSVLLAETLASVAADYASEPGFQAFGLDINANHLRSAASGWVTATAAPVHIGRSTQVWQIELADEKGRLVCVSRLTAAVLPK